MIARPLPGKQALSQAEASLLRGAAGLGGRIAVRTGGQPAKGQRRIARVSLFPSADRRLDAQVSELACGN